MPVEVSPTKSTLDKLLEKKETFSYKAKGIFNGQFFQQLDERINFGWSKFYNFRITKVADQYGDYGKSGILKPGDFISIDIPGRKISVDLSDAEMEQRFKELDPFEPKIKTGYLSRYSRMVTSANTGAVLK